MTGSTTSGWSSAASEVRLSIGTPSRTAMRATATSSARRVRIVAGWQGRMRLPLKPRRGLLSPAEIGLDVPAQALREVLPGRAGLGLDRAAR